MSQSSTPQIRKATLASGERFWWRFWIISVLQLDYVAIKSGVTVYAYALEHLGFEQANFDLLKVNEKVWMFHERFVASGVPEDLDDIRFLL